jgi:hypothetical protein
VITKEDVDLLFMLVLFTLLAVGAYRMLKQKG